MDFTEFYEKHQGLVWRCAAKVAKRYGCGAIRKDLASAGMIAVMEQISRYDEQEGAAVTTFLYPHVIGAMRREVARHFGQSRRQFRERRENGTLASSELESTNDIRLASEASVEEEVYIKICLEYLRTAFDKLSFREREILGGFFGVYGHKKETLAAIGEEFQIKESAALKAKDKALEKLRRVCLDGELGYWMSVGAAIREAQRDCVISRGDLGRWTEPEGCEVVE